MGEFRTNKELAKYSQSHTVGGGHNYETGEIRTLKCDEKF